MFQSDKESLTETLRNLRELRKSLQTLIRENKKVHPEHCTPMLYAKLQERYDTALHQLLSMVELRESGSVLMQQMADLWNGGAMPDISPEIMEELSEGLGSEFKDL